MICLKKLSILIFFSIIIFKLDLLFSSLMDLSFIATPNGLVRVKTLKKGDRLLSYNLNATEPEKTIVEASVTKIEKHFTDSVFNIYLSEDRCISVSPQQFVFAVRNVFDQSTDVHFDIELVQAQYLTTDHMLIDINMNLIPIVEIGKISLYEEKRVKKTICFFFKKKKTIITKFVPIEMYSMELEEPHILLVPACKYGVKPQDDPDLPLLLMHNGLAVLGIGISFTFDMASISFAEVTATASGLTATFGPAGFALGATAGLGYLAYEVFFRNNDKLYIEGSDPDGPNDKDDPKGPKGKKDKNFPPPPPLGKKNDKDKGNKNFKNGEYPEDRQTTNTRKKDATFKSERDARNLARKKVGKDPIDIGDNKLRSQDGKWQYRAKPNDVNGRHGKGEHIHLEHLNPDTGKVLDNWHFYWQ
jgi:hypothetical protein